MSARAQQPRQRPAEPLGATTVHQLRAVLGAARDAERARARSLASAGAPMTTGGSAVPDAVVGGGKASGPHKIIRNDDKILGVLLDGQVYLHTKQDGTTAGSLFGAIRVLVERAAVRAQTEPDAFVEDADAGGNLALSLAVGAATEDDATPRTMRMTARARGEGGGGGGGGGAEVEVLPVGRLEWALPK